jgi:hypothetical protein
MSRDEAEQLNDDRISDFCRQNTLTRKAFTREEYDAIADDYLAKKARRLSMAQQAARAVHYSNLAHGGVFYCPEIRLWLVLSALERLFMKLTWTPPGSFRDAGILMPR